MLSALRLGFLTIARSSHEITNWERRIEE